MRSPIRRPAAPRRGVTLVEMLVVVALVVLMMTILVQIFQSATGAMSLSRTTQELDVVLRQVDSMIRADLVGSTAKMTPPNDPTQKTGYFEIGENSFADNHGEDTDDYMAFTTKAPQGQVFTGRQWVFATPYNPNIQPITITSQVGEVIYFLRNGNLYRRVFLVAPDRAKSIALSVGSQVASGYQTTIFGGSLNVSWQGMNDISCRPGGFSGLGALPPIPNDLGDLTNRENRAFRPRFLNDFTGGNNGRDGVADDNNGDGIPDYYPTLYYDGVGNAYRDANGNPVWAPNSHMSEVLGYTANPRVEQATGNSYDVYAFPFIYPGMYSVPEPTRRASGLGWVHYMPLGNHSPLDLGDSLPVPSNANQLQTWWGFPTWRETMAGTRGNVGGWSDPVNFLSNNLNAQPTGLKPFPPGAVPSTTSPQFLPPVYKPGTTFRPFSFDGAGSVSFVADPDANNNLASRYPTRLWEDDLILTNVRSFDIKVYDTDAPLYNSAGGGLFSAGYHDLGYGGFLAGLTGNGTTLAQNDIFPFQPVYPRGSSNEYGLPLAPAVDDRSVGDPAAVSKEPVGFGHEGRIPPRSEDFRYHPRVKFYDRGNRVVRGNLGDNSAGVIRLTRIWDSWSTDYTKAYDSDAYNNGFSALNPAGLPIYPSFPAPYPSPLRGIQIQIRIVDPRNERSKVLTIRHDFTDKL